jgi:hypothetical protein
MAAQKAPEAGFGVGVGPLDFDGHGKFKVGAEPAVLVQNPRSGCAALPLRWVEPTRQRRNRQIRIDLEDGYFGVFHDRITKQGLVHRLEF